MADIITDLKKRADGSLEEARSYFKQSTGRDFNEQELSWLTAGRGDVGKVSNLDAARAYVAGLNTYSQRILSDAQNVYGMSDFTIEDANKLRDKLYIAGDQESYNTFWDRAGAALQNAKTESLINPKVDPTKMSANQGTAARLIRENLGREASVDEIEFYTDLLNKGEKPFEVQQFLQNTPEFMEIKANKENERVKTESAAARESLNTELLKGQQEAFNRALPTIMSSYQKAGRIGSSGVANAMARAQQELDRERQGFLANAAYNDSIRAQGYNREDFVNRGAQAFNQYLRQSEPRYQGNAFAIQQSYQNPFQLGQGLMARRQELADYDRQMNDYNRYAEQARSQQNKANLWGFGGNILGAGLQGLAFKYAYK